MNCPKCDELMEEKLGRIKWKPPFGRSAYVLKEKTKRKRIWCCPRCKKAFALLLTLRRVEVVEAE